MFGPELFGNDWITWGVLIAGVVVMFAMAHGVK